MTNILDTDYIYAVTLVRIWEKKLISAQTFDKLYEQGSFEDVMSVAHEAGYASHVDYDIMLSQELQNTYADLKHIAPNADVFDLFLIKNDYHNLKVCLRAAAQNRNMDSLLLTNARYDVSVVKNAILNEKFDDFTMNMKRAYQEGSKILASSHNPQLSDMVVDQYMFADLMEQAKKIDNAFLIRLFQTEIDLTNIKMAFRIVRMNKDIPFAKKAIIDGGIIPKESLLEVMTYPIETLVDFYTKTIYKSIVEDVKELTQIEIRCDNYRQTMLTNASTITFGIEPLVAYLLKKQDEIEKLRMLLVAKKNGISSIVLQERLGVSHA